MWSPREIREAMRPYDIPIVAIILALVLYFVVRNWRSRRQTPEAA
jgi:hypothetical protein